MPGPRGGVEQAVGIDHEPAQSGVLEGLLEPVDVGAFGEPDAPWIAAETTSVIIAGRDDLAPDRRRMGRQERKQAVSGGGGDDFEITVVLELAEGADEIAVVGEPGGAIFLETPQVELREVVERFFPVRPVCFAIREFDLDLQMAQVPALEERVLKHGTQGRADGQREAGGNAVPAPSLKDLDEGKVRFRDGLIEPGFLKKSLVFRVPDEREMGMEDESDVAAHRGKGGFSRRGTRAGLGGIYGDAGRADGPRGAPPPADQAT